MKLKITYQAPSSTTGSVVALWLLWGTLHDALATSSRLRGGHINSRARILPEGLTYVGTHNLTVLHKPKYLPLCGQLESIEYGIYTAA